MGKLETPQPAHSDCRSCARPSSLHDRASSPSRLAGSVRNFHRRLRPAAKSEAKQLLSQLNELLAQPQYHDAAARAEAERRFDKRVVEIFFYKMVPEETDYRAIRNDFIRLPDSENDNYRRVLLLGTTGAGKTTLGRQLIGTDPEQERFPSTSTAKTTIHDTEIVMAPAPWKAIATFTSMEEVREYLTECVSAAVLSAWNDATDSEILCRLLNHELPKITDFSDLLAH